MDVAEVVAAKRFVLVDDADTPRAALTVMPRGAVGLQLLDSAGENSMVLLAVNKENETPIVMIEGPEREGRRGRASITVSERGRAGITLLDADGRERTLLTYN